MDILSPARVATARRGPNGSRPETASTIRDSTGTASAEFNTSGMPAATFPRSPLVIGPFPPPCTLNVGFVSVVEARENRPLKHLVAWRQLQGMGRG
jgi:hypothetical protein